MEQRTNTQARTYTSIEVARRLGCSAGTIRRLARVGAIVPVTVGGRAGVTRYYTEATVRALEASRGAR